MRLRDSRYCACNKATNVPKIGVRAAFATAPCVKLTVNRNRIAFDLCLRPFSLAPGERIMLRPGAASCSVR